MSDDKPSWLLRGSSDGGTRVWVVPIRVLPFRIGRRPGLSLTLPADSISSEHAEIFQAGGDLLVRDLQSTNGTFVNGQRVSESVIRGGDTLFFADFEFRLEEQAAQRPETQTVSLNRLALPSQFQRGSRELEELLREETVSNDYQSIVTLPAASIVGYEALGRGRHPDLPVEPSKLLALAATLGVAGRLSRLFRRHAVETVKDLAKVKHLFFNTHPVEVGQPDLLTSLEELRAAVPDLSLTLEVHEAAVVNSESIREFRSRLSSLDIGLAYDDFGSGQARLLELAEVPPDHLKFDVRFVHGIADAAASKQRLVRSLVAMARDLGAEPIAEGVETAAEAQVCQELGFQLAQGFHYSRPVDAKLL